jgi:hypothetical protein
VTLTSNINTAAGLTNGARGTVVDIVYSKQPNIDLPDFIAVRWPDYTGPEFFSSTMNNGKFSSFLVVIIVNQIRLFVFSRHCDSQLYSNPRHIYSVR